MDYTQIAPHTLSPRIDREAYTPFENMETRNGLQTLLEIPLMLWALRIPLGGRLLEIGCGRGIAIPVFEKRLHPSAIVGVDIDATLLEEAESRAAGLSGEVSFMQGDVRALAVESRSFDLVVDFGTCYHVSGGEDGARAALGEVARVLKPGGLFVHESPIAQHLAHPVRSFGRSLPWSAVPHLVRHRAALLWCARRKAP